MSNMEIYYFSGTGNSLYVAKELQKRFPGAVLIPVVSLLNNDVIESTGDTVGFVFPIHGMTIPVPVKKFLEKADLRSASYIFAVATRAGTIARAFDKINKILGKNGRALDSQFILNMASNDPKFKDWRPATKDEMAKIESDVQEKLDVIKNVVIGREKYNERDTTGKAFEVIFPFNVILEKLVLLGIWSVEHIGVNDYFYADSKCTGCGTCEKVCLSGKVKMVDKRPVWQNKTRCHFCYTCLNFCPAQAVQIKSKIYMKSYTPENERYPHPYAKVSDMTAQKEFKVGNAPQK
jgi:ferredoxin/flavodoxin